MDKKEFVNTCIICGYASKKNALTYSIGKTEFTEQDLYEVHRINERKLYLSKVNTRDDGNISGDALIEKLAETTEPWNYIFDSSRGIKRSFYL